VKGRIVNRVAACSNRAGARGRRPAAMLAAGVAVALLAGCGHAGTGAPRTQPGQQLRRALRVWAGFPAGASPRPLVITGQRVTDPPRGFPSGDAKLAYLERAVEIPATLPSGVPAAAGFPLISAREAARVFTSTAAKGPPVATRLTVTAVRLGSGVFQTDRGPRRLPAWLLRFTGIQGPAAVLAVAPARIFSPARLPAGRPPFVNGARLGPDGRTLTVEFTGAQSGTGPCTAGYRLQLAESSTAVAVAVRGQAHGGDVPCSAVGYPRQATAVLSAPLGGRVVVDAVSGAAVAVTTTPGG
jgi:hypothetical protein